jgi:tRNA threonylcarbamoyladenosine biosynthesis protein TsaB
MKILAIDTSGQQAGAAVAENGVVLGKITVAARTPSQGWKHSQILLPAIAQLLGENGLALKDIGCIAYTCGPGSFTGLRIGAATALGLARGAGLPVVQVPTLDAMAYTGINTGADKVVPMIDARRGQVYAAVYTRSASGKPQRITDYLAAPIEDVMELAGDATAVNEAVDPVTVALWAADNFDSYPFGKGPELLYVRAPQAVREKEAAEATCK